MNIEFSRPLVLIGIPIAIGLLIFSARYMFIKNKSHRVLQVGMRALIVTLLLLALSGVSLKWKGNSAATVFLLDISDSMKENEDEMLHFVNDAVKEKSEDDSIGIVAFGSDARVEQFVSDQITFSEFQTTVTRTATNLESAVTTALAMMPLESAKRIVLLTDGVENEGSIKNTISSVVTSKCLVEVVKMETGSSAEVCVSDISVPDSVGTGENFSITVKIESNVATAATVSLYSGRTLKGQQKVNLQKGVNTFVFRDTQSEEGLKTYRVQVDAEKDTITANNEYLAYTNISTRKPLLVVEGTAGESLEFVKVLDSIQVQYQVVQPVTAPASLSEMNQYSGIIFVNVYADDLRKGFMENIETYVRDYGGGFITTGGNNSYALGNYKDTALENVLPVDMDLQGENEIPTMAIMLVIDKSGSMSSGNGVLTNLDLAKQAAVSALDNLRDIDYIGVIAFDDGYEETVKLQKASNHTAIENSIYSISCEGGTSIYPALDAAVNALENNPAKVKHIILLTDGQDSYDNYSRVISKINNGQITLSAVAVGQGCNQSLLNMLSEECGGRYYYTDINSDIPRIFAQEVFLSVNSYLVEGDFVPVVTSDDEIISSVAEEGLPSLLGYVATTKKARATQLLQSQEGEPILCLWQYGLGKTAAWTSDVKNIWSANWAGWDKTSKLWYNLIQYITTDMGMEGAYAEVEQNGKTATIKYVTETFDAATTVQATISDDKGEAFVTILDPVMPGVYTADFDMNDTGVYSINLQQLENGETVGSINTATMMQYSLEYRFYEETTVLEEYTKAVGGNMITAANEVFNEELDMVKQRTEIGTFLLVVAVLLFIADIAIRRFSVNLPDYLPMARLKAFVRARAEKKAALDKNVKQTVMLSSADVLGADNKEKKSAKSEQKISKKAVRKEKKEAKKTVGKAPVQEKLDTSKLLNRMKK